MPQVADIASRCHMFMLIIF